MCNRTMPKMRLRFCFVADKKGQWQRLLALRTIKTKNRMA